MDYRKFLDKLEGMSHEEFQEIKKTDDYRALNREPSVKEEFMAVLSKRRSNDRKRERLLEVLYRDPKVLEWIKDIENYRTLRIEQAWVSIAIRGGENDGATKSTYESLDRQRRSCHNKALGAFCRLVEKTSPIASSRTNIPPKDGSSFIARDELEGDLYDGPLMIPYEEANQYGDPSVRNEMTTGMFGFLKLIEQTPRSDWDRARERVLARITIDPSVKIPDITEVQGNLNRVIRGFGMYESPDKDDFSTDLFDIRDNKFKTTKKGKSRYDDLEFGGE